MTSIQDSPFPLAFEVDTLPDAFRAPVNGTTAVRTTARALQGMQKEAVVSIGPSGKIWRMVCDEGPYLNGTDLAPFPLAFFCTGMVNSYMAAFCNLLEKYDISFRQIRLKQDNYYSMEGSAIAGTMTGSALPVQLQLEIDSDADPVQLTSLLRQAVDSTPVGALLASVLANSFSIRHNNRAISNGRVEQCPPIGELAHNELFEALSPKNTRDTAEIISKIRSAAIHEGVSGGVGSSLASNQKRVLHMQGICTLQSDGMRETLVDLYSPIGSQFRFLSDNSVANGGQGRAPCSLAYLNAGIAFCFLTQIGRYAHIRKKLLKDYFVVQDMHCNDAGASASADMNAIQTHVWLDSGHDDDYARQVVDMSEQTCFLHAACRMPVEVIIKAISE